MTLLETIIFVVNEDEHKPYSCPKSCVCPGRANYPPQVEVGWKGLDQDQQLGFQRTLWNSCALGGRDDGEALQEEEESQQDQQEGVQRQRSEDFEAQPSHPELQQSS